jgi:hypothetical protein
MQESRRSGSDPLRAIYLRWVYIIAINNAGNGQRQPLNGLPRIVQQPRAARHSESTVRSEPVAGGASMNAWEISSISGMDWKAVPDSTHAVTKQYEASLTGPSSPACTSTATESPIKN